MSDTQHSDVAEKRNKIILPTTAHTCVQYQYESQNQYMRIYTSYILYQIQKI